MKRKFPQCECRDPGCSVHPSVERCNKAGLWRVARYDYEGDSDHFKFCPSCAKDAADSGVFSIEGA